MVTKTTLFLLLISCCGFAQAPLQVGDRLPDVTVQALDGKTILVKDLSKQGLLLIDFWATWCSPCLQEMRGADTLIKKFKGQVNVLAVSHDSATVVKRFLAAHPDWALSRLLITSDDRVLTKLFPHQSLPHNVWISKDNQVAAITAGEEFNEKNIRDFLGKQQIKLPVKHDAKFNQYMPYHVADSELTYRSIITGYNDSIPSGLLLYGFTWQRYFVFNRPLSHHYWLAYTQQLVKDINWDFIELHTRDSSKFYLPALRPDIFKRSRWSTGKPFYQEQAAWSEANLYCYELRLPHALSGQEFREAMFQDLYRYSKVRAAIENRDRLCTYVTFKGKLAPSVYAKQPEVNFIKGHLVAKGVTLEQLFLRLDQFLGGVPYLDKSGLAGTFDVAIDLGTAERPTQAIVEAALEKQGFKFRKKVQPYPVLVLYDEN